MILKNKTVLITGGNSGLGFEITKQLIKKKCKVIILGKNKKNVELAVKKLETKLVKGVVCDLQNPEEINKVSKKLKIIDILINCAGVINYGKLEDHSTSKIKELINVNLLGTIFMTRAILLKMKKQNSGMIVNISSTSGLPSGGHPYESVYIASKFGVYGFTEGLKIELEEEKSHINVIGFYPGGMNTKLFEKSGLDKDTSKFMDPKEIANIIVFILERPESIKIDHILVNRNKNM
jgi:short-subunit dehydrogenase